MTTESFCFVASGHPVVEDKQKKKEFSGVAKAERVSFQN